MQITNAGDLRTAYLQTFDGFAITPGDIVDSSEGRVNMRYARELLGTLVNANLVTVTDVNGDGEDAWQTMLTHDEIEREDAERIIDGWLASQSETENTPQIRTKGKNMTESTNTKPEAAPHDCYCGCGEQVPGKSFYRPGHDARHAGALARKVAADASKDVTTRTYYSDLPSEKLVTKAIGIALAVREKADAKVQRETEKAEAKAKREAEKATNNQPKPPANETGTIKVGKNEFAAERNGETGQITYFKGDKTLVASASAAKTFTV